ncbi:MAG TPA: ABC transporter substrate-binding protein, partial [Stellaceae bacterium]|nr:ABC transporter substrate-binding protein [Stellaceae bacterium]
VDVGMKVGTFARHGIDVQLTNFQGSSRMHQAMVAGDIDIGVGAGPELVLIAKGSPELAVCDADPAAAFLGIAVPEGSPIRTIGDLRGKRLSVSSIGGLTYWLALELSRKQGWGEHGLDLVAIGNASSSVVAALRTHNVDAAYTSTALAFLLEEKHEGRLLAPATAYEGGVGAGMIFATKQLIERNPDAIRRFLAGWLETIAYMRKNRAETVAIEAALTGFSPTVQAKEYDLTISMFDDDCRFDAESLDNLKRSFADLKLLPSPPDMAKLYTEAFLPKR